MDKPLKHRDHPIRVVIKDIYQKPCYETAHQRFYFNDVNDLLINLCQNHYYGQFHHYWYGLTPPGYPQAQISRDLRNHLNKLLLTRSHAGQPSLIKQIH